MSPGCTNCYAEKGSHRNPAVLGVWGADGRRVIAAESYWRMPFTWERAAKAAGERRRVFCASLADVFEDRPELVEPRRRLFGIIAETPNLDWLLLTKRPEFAATELPIMVRRVRDILIEYGRRRPLVDREHVLLDSLVDRGCFPNVWLGTSVEDRKHGLPRVGVLREIPAAVRFLSVEPLLEDLGPIDLAGIDWVIVGGESGPRARPFDLGWARSIVGRCWEAGVACFVKQLGANPRDPVKGPEFGLPVGTVATGYEWCLSLRDKKGGDIDEFPADLRVREFPGGLTR